MPNMDTETLIQLLEDENLQALLKRSMRECLSWSDFLRMQPPTGISPMDTWDLLFSARRSSAIYFPIPDTDDTDYWYTPTYQINSTLALIECACRHKSTLHRAVSDAPGQQFLVRSRIEESVAAAQLDGLGTPPEKTREMLSLDRSPKTPNERLLRNALDLTDRMEDFLDEPFSPELLYHLHDEVTKGVDVDRLITGTRRLGFDRGDRPKETLSRLADRQLKYICDYANGTTGDPYDHAIVKALIIRDSIRGYRVLPVASGTVGRLVFSLFAMKSGLPVLAMLPISKASLEWEEGRLVIPTFPEHTISHQSARYKEYDLTPYITITTQVILQALQELGLHIDRTTKRDAQIRAALQEDAQLNHRQRSILGRALRIPDAEFNIRYHKTKHNVAYATARADLMKLTEMGYLEQTQRGKAFVFVATPDLKRRLAPLVNNEESPGDDF